MLKGGGIVVCDFILGGVIRHVTTCEEGEGGVNFSLRMCDVIYGRSHTDITVIQKQRGAY